MPKVMIVLEAQTAEGQKAIKEYGRAVEDTVSKLRAANPALEGTRVSVRNLTSAKVDAFKASQQWSGVLTVLPGQLGSVASQATTLVSALGRAGAAGGLVGGLLAVAGAGFSLVKSLSDDIERLDNLSRQTGLAIGSLQAFEHAARQAGEAPDTLVQGLGRVNQAINDVLMGTANAGKAFSAIGVNLRQLVKDGASTEDILEATARALAAIPDPTARAAAQMELFGTRGRAISTVLDTIAQKTLPGYRGELEQVGIVTSRETIQMAKDFDTMVDAWTERLSGWLMKLKAAAAQAVIDWRKLGAPEGTGPGTRFPIPGSAMGDVTFPGERPPPQDPGPRTLGPTPEELAATKAAEAARMKLFQESHAALLEEDERVRQILGERTRADYAERIRAEDATTAAVVAIRLDGINRQEASLDARTAADKQARAARLAGEVDTARQIQDLTKQAAEAVAAEQIRAQQETNAIIASTSTGRIRAIEDERAKVRQILDTGVQDVQTTEDLKLRILELTVARDVELEQQKVDRALEIRIAGQERMNAILALRVTAEQRAAEALLKGQILAAEGSGDAWGVFTGRFQLEVTHWGTAMQQFGRMGADTAVLMRDSLSDVFFDVITGKLHDLEDVWTNFWQSMVRMITDFLASAAVSALMNFILGLAGGSGGISVGNLAASTATTAATGAAAAGATGASIALPGGGTLILSGGAPAALTGGGVTGGLVATAPAGIMPGVGMPGFTGAGVVGGTAGSAGVGAAGLGGPAVVSSEALFPAGGAVAAEGAGGGAAFGGLGAAGAGAVAGWAAIAGWIAFSIATNKRLSKDVDHMTQVAVQELQTSGETVMAGGPGGFLGLAHGQRQLEGFGAGPLSKQLGISKEQAQQLIEQNGAEIRALLDQQVKSVLGGQDVMPGGFTPEAFAQMSEQDRQLAIGQRDAGLGQARGILGGVEGFSSLSSDVQLQFANMAAAFSGNEDLIIQLVQSLSEQLPEGLRLSNEQAAELVTQLEGTNTATQQLTAQVLDTSAGVGDAAVEAQIFAEAIRAGQVPAGDLQQIYASLASEHGPGFTQAVTDALVQLGLSNAQIQEMVGGLQTMGEGVNVPVHYSISVSGSPPPGAGGPSVQVPTAPRGDFQFGLLEGPIPGPFGAPRLMQAHGGELVITPNQATGLLRAIERGGRGDPEDRALMVAQNKLLSRLVEAFERAARWGGGRPAGAAV